jgi:hypothetical protein
MSKYGRSVIRRSSLRSTSGSCGAAATIASILGGFVATPIAAQTARMQLPPRLESLVVKSGPQLGAVSDTDRALALALASCAIEPGWPLREDEVNRRLSDWLADVGQMLHTDHSSFGAGSSTPDTSRATTGGTPTCAEPPSSTGLAKSSGRPTEQRWQAPSARRGLLGSGQICGPLL